MAPETAHGHEIAKRFSAKTPLRKCCTAADENGKMICTRRAEVVVVNGSLCQVELGKMHDLYLGFACAEHAADSSSIIDMEEVTPRPYGGTWEY